MDSQNRGKRTTRKNSLAEAAEERKRGRVSGKLTESGKEKERATRKFAEEDSRKGRKKKMDKNQPPQTPRTNILTDGKVWENTTNYHGKMQNGQKKQKNRKRKRLEEERKAHTKGRGNKRKEGGKEEKPKGGGQEEKENQEEEEEEEEEFVLKKKKSIY